MAGRGRKLWTKETLSSTELQDFLQDQTVMRFASAAARGAGIPNPTEGMLSYLDDVDRVDFHTGAAWLSVPPVFLAQTAALAGAVAPAGTPLKVVAFSAVTTTNGVGDSAAMFPAAFPKGVQTVVASSGDYVAGGHAYCTVQSTFLDRVVLAHRQANGTSIVNVNVRTNIIAVGW